MSTLWIILGWIAARNRRAAHGHLRPEQVAVVDAGHLMTCERPQEINALVLDFFTNE
ncbi:MAG: hypothetical protein R3293_20935 [Candidatus Promineifilaceae bacterium]|nr:hypothetical protein [Candidatus Promineifilaceae bacterium]